MPTLRRVLVKWLMPEIQRQYRSTVRLNVPQRRGRNEGLRQGAVLPMKFDFTNVDTNVDKRIDTLTDSPAE